MTAVHTLDVGAADRLWELIEAGRVIWLPYTGTHYFDWQDLAYQFMVRDQLRNGAYRRAIREAVNGKIVVEIGPGSRLVMTRLCIEAGARKIYAIEANPPAFDAAAALVDKLGLSDRVTLIHARSVDAALPEPADVCVSEIIGSIGNGEGAAHYINDAWRFLGPSGTMIPSACQTLVCPVQRPAMEPVSELVDEVVQLFSGAYSGTTGRSTEFSRHKVYNFPLHNLLASPQLFEDLCFSRPDQPEGHHARLSFRIAEAATLDGLLLWIHLDVGGVLVRSTERSNWAPVFVALRPFAVQTEDTIEVICAGEWRADAGAQAYTFEVSIVRAGSCIYRCVDAPDV